MRGSAAPLSAAGHVPTQVLTCWFKALFEIVRGDAAAARRDAEIVVKLSRENALEGYTAGGAVQSAWASARPDSRETRVMELRQALAAHRHGLNESFYQG